jgi:hypothetical protein
LAELDAVKLLLFVKYGNINKIQNTYLQIQTNLNIPK